MSASSSSSSTSNTEVAVGAGSGNMVDRGTGREWSIYLNKRSLQILTRVRLRQRLDDLQCRERPTGKGENVNPCKSKFPHGTCKVRCQEFSRPIGELRFSYFYISLTVLYAHQ